MRIKSRFSHFQTTVEYRLAGDRQVTAGDRHIGTPFQKWFE
jgi:hypothetical protein